MRKATTTEEVRKQIDARFKPVVRGGEICIIHIGEDGKPLNYNKVLTRDEYFKNV